MNPNWESIFSDLIHQLTELDDSRRLWEPHLDVYSTDIAGKAEQVINTPQSALETISKILVRPGVSFRAATDTLMAVTCWLYLHSDARIRESLRNALAPCKGVVTLLANISGRFFIRFQTNHDLHWLRFSLAAISLLGDNAEYRDDSLFLAKVRALLLEQGQDAARIFDEFVNMSSGQAHALFVAARDTKR